MKIECWLYPKEGDRKRIKMVSERNSQRSKERHGTEK